MDKNKIDNKVNKGLRNALLKKGNKLTENEMYLSDGVSITESGELISIDRNTSNKERERLRKYFKSVKSDKIPIKI